MLRRTLNLGILAHVDAGKTTLTERLLYAAGVIDEPGSVDDGSTQTDSLALERQRGITIRSAVVSFAIEDVTVNLIDTPGHPDFIAEVERVLGVLDGAVLVVSAVEGVQPQTPLLMRALQRLGVPTLVFVNKVDRTGADCSRVLRAIRERLTPSPVALGAVRDAGTRVAGLTPYGADDASFVATLASVLADHDDALLAAYVEDETGIPYGRLRDALAEQTGLARVHPVLFGSAITGAGVDVLSTAIAELLPARSVDPAGPASGTVFKVDHGSAGEKIAYVRMFSGTLRVRDRVRVGADDEAKVTAIGVFDRGGAVRRQTVAAGQVGQLWGLGGVRVGDTIGARRRSSATGQFAPPTLETVIVPRRPADKGALHAALARLAESDPLINVRQDDLRQELFLSLYGEVQKEVIEATLADEFGLDVDFRETTAICIERPLASGTAVDHLGAARNPFLATVGLRVEPAPIGTGVAFRLAVDVGSIPLYVFRAAEEFEQAVSATVRRTLLQGLCGWEVTDCAVTLTESGYAAPSTRARDFRLLTPLVLMNALKEAGTVVCEPIHSFVLELPADTLGSALRGLARLDAVPGAAAMRGSTCTLEGEIPAARAHALQRQLRGMTRGEGVLELAFARYAPVRGTIPARPRSDFNPLNREEYLLHLARRVGP